MDDVVRNRRVNYKRKVTSEIIDKAQEQLNRYKEAAERGRLILANLEHNPGWEALRMTYAEKVESIDLKLEEFKDLPDKHVNALLAERKFCIEVRDLIDRMKENVQFMEEKFAEEKAKLDERSQRLRAEESSKF